MTNRPFRRLRLVLAALFVGVAVGLAACGGGGGETTAAPETTAPPPSETETAPPATETEAPPATETQAAESVCGLGNGEEATGEPIKVGGVVTNGAGIDFSSATDAAAAFFACVNANGGINGRPVDYIVENDELNPEKAGQLAAKLVQDDQVVALVGSTSFVDCAVNQKLYEENGFRIIYAVGIPQQCFETAPFAATNTGPMLSGVGAAQYAVETLGAKKLFAISGNIPSVGDYTNNGIKGYAESVGIPYDGILVDLPVKDPAAVAAQAVQAAGPDGAVVMIMPVPEDIAVMKAAEAAGQMDQTMWTCATPCNDLGFADAVGSAWDGKIFTNSELNLTDSTGPDNQLWLKVMDEYGSSDDPRDNFSQAGFIAAKIFTDTILKLDPATLDRATISEAISQIKNYVTDLECKPWYWPPEGASHYPNNSDRTVVLQGGKQVEAENGGCFDIAFPGADALRAIEVEQGLNTGAGS